mmetsp:Transcript_19453/g.43295  ORF Transcript_19453/g.43295 Transcript_19453/m.43295 type:complete len:390 (+) Transcript_19453:40-1209(+)
MESQEPLKTFLLKASAFYISSPSVVRKWFLTLSLALLFLAIARSAAFDASLVFDMKRRFSSWLSDAPEASKVAEKISRSVSFVMSWIWNPPWRQCLTDPSCTISLQLDSRTRPPWKLTSSSGGSSSTTVAAKSRKSDLCLFLAARDMLLVPSTLSSDTRWAAESKTPSISGGSHPSHVPRPYLLSVALAPSSSVRPSPSRHSWIRARASPALLLRPASGWSRHPARRGSSAMPRPVPSPETSRSLSVVARSDQQSSAAARRDGATSSPLYRPPATSSHRSMTELASSPSSRQPVPQTKWHVDRHLSAAALTFGARPVAATALLSGPLYLSATSSASPPNTTEHASRTRHAAYCSSGRAPLVPDTDDRHASQSPSQFPESASRPSVPAAC